MPRRLRLHLSGVPLHITHRGNNRQNCFFCEEDYVAFLGLMEELAPEHECSLHAYVLMTNHVHFVMSAENASGLSFFMKNLGQRYAQLMNRNHRRTGSLWEGRFHSSLIDSQGYLLRCYRYVERNPVRARMVAEPHQYRWSSFRANAWGMPSPIVTAHPSYVDLGADVLARAEAYSRLFAEQESEFEVSQIRQAVQCGLPWGSDAFLDEMEAIFGVAATRRKATTTPCGSRSEKAEDRV